MIEIISLFPYFAIIAIIEILRCNSIIKLYSECKLLQCYANQMTRSINNKLAQIDLKPFHNLATAAQKKSNGK